ncbi:MAG: GlcG/HbpS family heme-binding protein [Halocynthiibacter sp.]
MKHLLLTAALIATPAFAEDDALYSFQFLTPEVAMKAAMGAMTFCRDQGYQVGVSVTDRFGGEQAFVRDRFAGSHVNETAHRKAWTAASFRGDTLTLAETTGPDTRFAGIRDLTMPLALGGGVPIESAGSIVGGIGVSGAPDPKFDDDCARAGIEAIIDDLGF